MSYRFCSHRYINIYIYRGYVARFIYFVLSAQGQKHKRTCAQFYLSNAVGQKVNCLVLWWITHGSRHFLLSSKHGSFHDYPQACTIMYEIKFLTSMELFEAISLFSDVPQTKLRICLDVPSSLSNQSRQLRLELWRHSPAQNTSSTQF